MCRMRIQGKRFFLFIAMMMGNLLAQAQLEYKGMIPNKVDPKYEYEYELTKYVPPSGKALLMVGQNMKNINEYRDHSKYQNYPAGWSAYWAVSEFAGFEEAWTTVSGDTQYHGFLVETFDNMVIHSAMWMVGKWDVGKRVVKGTWDSEIKKYCDWAKTIDRPIYLRLGYEFDGPHNEFEPKDFVAAYKYVVDFMRAEGVDNVAYVWHSYASVPYKNYPVMDWYPGDDYVDWVAISVFFQPYDDIFNHKETDDILEIARAKKKPVMVAEANPVLGIKAGGKKVWNKWFVDFFTFCYQKNIRAIAFINEDWPRLSIEGIDKWKDSRLYNNPKVFENWQIEINRERYLRQSPELFELLEYDKKEKK